VSSILWRERQLLELLLFKLEEEQLLLAAGRSRWLAHATREVETVLEEIKQAELARAMEVELLAAELRLGPAPSLTQLVAAAPAPWGNILDEHRRAFLTASREITTLAQANRDLLNQGYLATREALSWLGETKLDTYSAAGVTAGVASGPRLLDEAM
jgi:hypothetical protein